jgi:hypothetical protein
MKIPFDIMFDPVDRFSFRGARDELEGGGGKVHWNGLL